MPMTMPTGQAGVRKRGATKDSDKLAAQVYQEATGLTSRAGKALRRARQPRLRRITKTQRGHLEAPVPTIPDLQTENLLSGLLHNLVIIQ